ncbi:MAG TPA: redoxin domain-containing protein [Candidatus Nanoarchaeia archaeon]|nr:redoxin domain-containing protein [Candidatus Nanoarchaeia archaeon]
MFTTRGKIIFVFLAVLLAAGVMFAVAMMLKDSDGMNSNKIPTGNLLSLSDYPDDVTVMFLCPCCGQVLDRKNICCGMAGDMIKYIDSLTASGISKDEVIMKTVEKYGINSVVESKRAVIQAALEKRNPSAFPQGKLSFSGAVGQKAPDFTLESIEGKTMKLSYYKGKNIVLFFNEGSMCYPSCWNQIAEFGNDERFNNDNAIVFSITPDQRDEWQKIVQKVPKLANSKILFDSARTVSSAYDVLNLPSSMHKGSYPGHTYFIIDKEMVVRYVFDDPRMGIQNDRIAGELSKIAASG